MLVWIIIAVLLLVAANFLALYRYSLRDIIAHSEYAQFLLLNPDVYEDHRKKFLEYLASTPQRTPKEGAIASNRALATIVRNMRGQMILANLASRNQIAGKAGRSAGESSRPEL
jgi:hypothetical protein